MNADTGHLVDLEQLPAFREDARYEPVPPHLHDAAVRRLRGRAETYVPKRSNSQLGKYAAEKRRAKQRAQKAARKRSRR
jgi:hypothetical protein